MATLCGSHARKSYPRWTWMTTMDHADRHPTLGVRIGRSGEVPMTDRQGEAVARRLQVAQASHLRSQGLTWVEIADALRQQFGLNARAAMRVAHGMSQAAVATAWSRRWPDDPKTNKNIS